MIPGILEEAERMGSSCLGAAFAQFAVAISGLIAGAIVALIAALWFGLIKFSC